MKILTEHFGINIGELNEETKPIAIDCTSELHDSNKGDELSGATTDHTYCPELGIHPTERNEVQQDV